MLFSLIVFLLSGELPRLPCWRPGPRANGPIPRPVCPVRHGNHHRDCLQDRPVLAAVPLLARGPRRPGGAGGDRGRGDPRHGCERKEAWA